MDRGFVLITVHGILSPAPAASPLRAYAGCEGQINLIQHNLIFSPICYNLAEFFGDIDNYHPQTGHSIHLYIIILTNPCASPHVKHLQITAENCAFQLKM